MIDLIEEWRQKAEGDFRTASREMKVIEDPNYDAVCFHSQQCIEKLMKALLIKSGAAPEKHHDLVRLSDLINSTSLKWSWPLNELRFLTRAAVEFRYPGEIADRDEAEQAFSICSKIQESIVKLF